MNDSHRVHSPVYAEQVETVEDDVVESVEEGHAVGDGEHGRSVGQVERTAHTVVSGGTALHGVQTDDRRRAQGVRHRQVRGRPHRLVQHQLVLHVLTPPVSRYYKLPKL